MQMRKYRARGADVTAVEVTDENAVEAAEEAGGTLFTSPRTGRPYLTLETPRGTQRAEAGMFLVRHEDGSHEVLDAEEFDARYARP